MISFDLRCPHDHVFEAWFSNSDAYEEQAKTGGLLCPICGSVELEKSLMSPNVSVGGDHASAAPKTQLPAASGGSEKGAELMRLARAVRGQVEQNFEHVGAGFAEEAKKIHFGETEHRDIYGEMTPDEAVDLRDDGVEFGVLPWPTKEDA
jgi:hypothetical protein